MDDNLAPEAPVACSLCPRLVKYRAANQASHPDWFNGAVPSFGSDSAKLLVVGLAPGVTGANRTGRPFTGDWAGDLLYATLEKFGYTKGTYQKTANDGLELVSAMITNAVRCVPPQNKPVGAEINTCRKYLTDRLATLPDLTVILPLGKIAHDSVTRALGLKLSTHPFGHKSRYETTIHNRKVTILSSYHCSRYNTNTGRLTEAMFEDVFETATQLVRANS